ncbi:sensor histidine kinase [Mangrovibacterium diazotrophicum]|uniref:histidine kinase n=1 Tax=Mangrovibacterium diazotrophicum TaxID=1261403 RepID=A0A419VVA4_9BACT|nr:HAMP domain-containing sensor histidine kinase [Mangrovibacterium diazotrophicum]RKD86051.1 two-component system phosphate regulon sensor histidine kinase PhoR [Mangrovibacterium diazotrophicum]
MGRNTLRVIIILATFSVLGILVIQFFFLKNTVDLNERKFHESTTQALKNVAQSLVDYNSKTLGYQSNYDPYNSVDQISNNYYVVNVNDVINPSLLEHLLLVEFKRFNIELDFEYAIYDCETNQMVYGISYAANKDTLIRSTYIPANATGQPMTDEEIFENHYALKPTKITRPLLPTCDKYTYYFGVYFPNRSQYYSSHVQAWYMVNGFLIIVILFFGYTLYVIFRQRQLSEIQKNFINNLTHEFKTPIAAIRLSAKVLEDPKIIEHPRRLTEYARIVGEQTQRLTSQVEKVLQMASLEKKIIELDKTEIHLNEFVEKTITDFKSSQETAVDFIQFEKLPVDVKIKADALHFSNIIFNILDNAVKYCHETPDIKVSLTKVKNTIYLRFADNGIGIPKEYRKKIFGRFFRIPTGDIHDVKGFGLGLDYVRKMTDFHRWKIDVEDNSPKGTIFTIIIPK